MNIKDKNFIIFDLEATCWEERNISIPHEVIEIGAVKLDSKLNVIDKFSIFIKPTITPILSDYCKNLTSITQNDIDTAKPFNIIIPQFEHWIGDNAIMLSWGGYDKNQINRETLLKDYHGIINEYLNSHLSFKHQFAKVNKIRPCGLAKALAMHKIIFEGTRHRAISDAENITAVLQSMYNNEYDKFTKLFE